MRFSKYPDEKISDSRNLMKDAMVAWLLVLAALATAGVVFAS
jgi:hypothetical protein